MVSPRRDPPPADNLLLVAVDIGGTFTDVTVVDGQGRRTMTKVPTTGEDPAIGFKAGIQAAIAMAGMPAAAITRTHHATTIATNAVLEGAGVPTALITTLGFRDVLAIGRHDGPRRTSLLHWSKPERPIPPDRIYEVDERTASDGTVDRAPDPQAVREIAGRLQASGIRSVAICLINSYAGAANEQAVAAILRTAWPSVELSISSDILPAMREYERSMLTALNASVMPTVGSYLGRLRAALDDVEIPGPLSIMQSNGGLEGVGSIAGRPVYTMLSGPAAGVIGAIEVAGAADRRDLITLDVGGTSTDVALVRDGRPGISEEGRVGVWPLALPMLDIHAVGAGGGSVASLDGSGGIMVGPRSARSRPGPACYGRGGTEPTVTDAQLVLGRLPTDLAGGAVRLDAEAAMAAIRTRIAEPLDIDPIRAAEGIVEIAEDNMASAIRLISTERGHDPRAYTLVAGGGAGPLHAAGIAAILGIETILIPPAPGMLSTEGLLVSGLRRDLIRVHVERLAIVDPATLRTIIGTLEADASAWFEAEGVGSDARRYEWSVTLRYPEQPSELLVPWPSPGRVDPAALEALAGSFHGHHRDRYGYDLPDRPVELVSVRVRATADVMPGSDLQRWTPPIALGLADPTMPATSRQVHLGRRLGFVDVPVIGRSSLGAGDRRRGPLVIEQADTTVLVIPGLEVWAHPSGSLLMTHLDGAAGRPA